MNLFFICLISYLIGSIPTAYIIGKTQNIDIRKHGSGNVGATNIYRVLGKKWGTITFIFDFLKGFIPTYIVYHNIGTPYIVILTGFFAIIGHIFTLFLSFKGGKGVATSTGVFTVISPYAVLIAVIVFIIITLITRYVSAGTLIANITFLITSLKYLEVKEYKIMVIITSILIFITHIPNIKRIIEGKELRFDNKG